MIKGHTDIDIWNTGFFINADYFSDDFIIYNNTGKDLTRKTLAHPFFHNNSYKTTYTSFILCLSGTSEIEIDSINYSTKENTLLMMVPNQIIKYNEISEDYINPEKPDVPLNKNDAFQKVQKRRVQEKR